MQKTADVSQSTPATTLESIPTVPFNCQAPLSLLSCFGSLIELHLLGKRGQRGVIPAVVSDKWGPAPIRTTASSARQW